MKHQGDLLDILAAYDITRIKIYDADNESHLSEVLIGMRKYDIDKTPSIVVLIPNEIPIVISGIKNSIEKLRNIIRQYARDKE
jgi:hypothetical protein